MRATSRLARLISLGVSRRSVADCTFRWNRFLIVSLSVRSSCSSLIARYSAGLVAFIAHPPGFTSPDARTTRHKPALEPHLVRHPRQRLSGRGLRQPTELKQDHAPLPHRPPLLPLG